MTETLKSMVEDRSLVEGCEVKGKEYTKPSSFAEMYMEEPADIQASVTPTVCTWRGIPTIDDW